MDKLKQKIKNIDLPRLRAKTRAFLKGNSYKTGFLYKVAYYSLLVLFGFCFIYPLIRMLVYSFMSPADVINPFVEYIPSKLYFKNYVDSINVLGYFKTLGSNLLIAIVPSLLQCITTSIIGYGLGRHDFKGKKIVLALVLLTFVIPPQVLLIPQVRLFLTFNIKGLLTYILTALFGQGIKSAIFIMIFYQFFRTLPKSLEEAGKIDGANVIQIFIFICAPLAISGYILTFLFSFVWYYNETITTAVYMQGSSLSTLPIQLEQFEASYIKKFASGAETGKSLNEAIYMAGTLLTILPLLLMYFVLQKNFVESIDKAGITGE